MEDRGWLSRIFQIFSDSPEQTIGRLARSLPEPEPYEGLDHTYPQFNEETGELIPRYRMFAQMTGTIENPRQNGIEIQRGEVFLVSPDGEIAARATFNSGGSRQEGLPGLNEDLLPGHPLAATYPLDNNGHSNWWTVSQQQMSTYRGYTTDDREFGFIRFFSDRYQTPRGVSTDAPGRSGAFAIHPDGSLDGTNGCLGFANDDEAEPFIRAFFDIPREQRPAFLEVLPPSFNAAPEFYEEPGPVSGINLTS